MPNGTAKLKVATRVQVPWFFKVGMWANHYYLLIAVITPVVLAIRRARPVVLENRSLSGVPGNTTSPSRRNLTGRKPSSDKSPNSLSNCIRLTGMAGTPHLENLPYLFPWWNNQPFDQARKRARGKRIAARVFR